MQKKIDKIIVRVYAIIINNGRILLSDEFWYDTPMTKFPGGGLEPGEGIQDCLRREIREELDTEVLSCEHFYTCDQMIASEFIPFTQVIPVYYLVKLEDYNSFRVSDYRYDFTRFENGAISLRWTELELLNVDELTFSGDRLALIKLKERIKI